MRGQGMNLRPHGGKTLELTHKWNSQKRKAISLTPCQPPPKRDLRSRKLSFPSAFTRRTKFQKIRNYTVLVSSCCRKLPSAQWLKVMQIHSPTNQRSGRGLKWVHGTSCHLEAIRENLFPCPFQLWRLPIFLASWLLSVFKTCSLTFPLCPQIPSTKCFL